jgi:hypothetical protein
MLLIFTGFLTTPRHNDNDTTSAITTNLPSTTPRHNNTTSAITTNTTSAITTNNDPRHNDTTSTITTNLPSTTPIVSFVCVVCLCCLLRRDDEANVIALPSSITFNVYC